MGKEYDIAEAISIAKNFGLENYDDAYVQLRNIFKVYRDCRIWGERKGQPHRMHALTEKYIAIAEKLIKRHAKLFGSSGNDIERRRHNTFVLYYVAGLTFGEIAKRQLIDKRTAILDRDNVLHNMMILVYGVDGLRKQPSKAVITLRATPNDDN